MKSNCQVFLTFDIETGGLLPEKHAILEIAFCPFDNEFNELPEHTTGIIKPTSREIDQRALDANGITREQINNGITEKEAFIKLEEYLKKLKRGKDLPIPCGHNIDKFDLPFLFLWFQEQGKDLGKYINLDYTIDTMWRSRETWTEQVNYKLGTCCQSAGISLMDAHRAINDTRANKELVKYFLLGQRGLRGSGESAKENKFRKTFEF
jgi:DNA polymerase III alpha subunit (gram-positive type)